MILRKTKASDLDKMQKNQLSDKAAMAFFCQKPYHYLYIMDGSIVVSVLKKDDVPLGEKLPPLRRDHVWIATEETDDEAIQGAFQQNAGVNRLAVLSPKKELLSEFDDMSQPNEARNILKNKMAIRYAPAFLPQLESLFADSGWNRVLFIGDLETYYEFSFLVSFRHIDHAATYLPDVASQYDIIFNFRYPVRYKKWCCPNDKIVEFYKVIERIAFKEMLSYCRERSIHFYLLRNPIFERLTCLSTEEKHVRDKKVTAKALLKNAAYIEKFSITQRNLRYLQTGNYRQSYAVDNGFIYEQSDIDTPCLTVKRGRRLTVGKFSNPTSTIYLFGTCITFGLYTTDTDTISSILQNAPYCLKNRINVQNNGALLGRNLLNICIDVLNTSLRDGDTVVVMDIFEDYPEDSAYGIIDTNDWFNQFKPLNEIWFLDFPLHCNVRANRMLAGQIETLLQRQAPFPSGFFRRDAIIMNLVTRIGYSFCSCTKKSLRTLLRNF